MNCGRDFAKGIGFKGPQGNPGTTAWSGLTGIPAGFADNTDNDTTYTAGTGIILTGTTLSLGQHFHTASDIVSGVLPIQFGGTGASFPDAARANIGAAGLINQNFFTRNQSIFLQTNEVGLSIKGANGQTSDLTQWLDVSGNVVARVTSAGAFVSASGGGSTRTINYSYKSFRPTSSSTPYNTNNGLQLSSGGVQEMCVVPEIPVGSTITQIQFMLFDNSGSNFTIALSAQNSLSNAAISNLVSEVSPNSPNGQVHTRTLSANVVVGANQGLYLRAFWAPDAAVDRIALFGATITYTLP